MNSSQVDPPLGYGRLARIYAATRRPPSPRVQRLLLGAASIVFLVGGWYALKTLDVSLDDVRWVPLALAAIVGVPLTLLSNTFEYILSGRILRHRMRFLPAFQVATISAAANLLPIPGAFLVRVQGLRTMGSLYSKALASTAIIGIAWIGVSAVLAGALLAASESWLVAAALTALGIPLLASGYMWLRRAVPAAAERRRLAVMIVAVELFAVGASAARLVLILIGLGVDASIDQTLVLAVSSSLAAAAGILPGGFGLRELIAAVLAPLVGLPAAAGFAATTINRVMGIVVQAPITAALALVSPQKLKHAEALVEKVDADELPG